VSALRPKADIVHGGGDVPLYPQKRTSLSTAAMSALCQKRTSRWAFDIIGAEALAGITMKLRRRRPTPAVQVDGTPIAIGGDDTDGVVHECR
jgi:hypothetical protein